MRRAAFSLLAVLLSLLPLPGWAAWTDQVKALAGPGGVVTADSTGRVLFGHNPDQPLIPGSTLKIVTAAVALAELGPDYRFLTDFGLTPEGDLVVTGRGDPLLTSEELAIIAGELKTHGLGRVRDILLDATYFTPGLVLDGTSRSLNPYDAFTGALAVNFNTIFVDIKRGGAILPAEPQTPLTPLARRMAAESRQRGRVRLNLADRPETCLYYAGELLAAFLDRAGIKVAGRVRPVAGSPAQAGPFLRHAQSLPLDQILTRMMKYSNNFIANQVWLSLGAERLGPPAHPDKSRRVVAERLAWWGLPPVRMEEGSGLSRLSRLSAGWLVDLLQRFRPHRELLTSLGPAWVKTGTLSDVQSLAGYFPGPRGEWLALAIILNGPQARPGSREKILTLLQTNLAKGD